MAVKEAALTIIEDLLFAQTGQQLTESRKWRVESALSEVCVNHNLSTVEELICRLATSNDKILAQDIVDALVNNETYFFRDRSTFDQLLSDILPELAKRREQTRRLEIWSAGCSTGQEAHSLAMEFAAKSQQWQDWSISVLGTDVSHTAIAAAKRAIFSQFDVQRGLGIDQLLAYFSKTPCGWQLSREIASATRFVVHNLIDRPLGRSKFDLILCRNVLLYFDPVIRQRAFERLYEALEPDGFLMLGAGETVVGCTQMFVPSTERPGIFEPVPANKLSDLIPAE